MSLDTVICVEIGLNQPISDRDLHVLLYNKKKRHPYGLEGLNFKKNGTFPYSDFIERSILRGIICGVLARNAEGELIKLMDSSHIKEQISKLGVCIEEIQEDIRSVGPWIKKYPDEGVFETVRSLFKHYCKKECLYRKHTSRKGNLDLCLNCPAEEFVGWLEYRKEQGEKDIINGNDNMEDNNEM